MEHSTAYEHGPNLYLNLTALCPTDCLFCMKRPAKRRFHRNDLSLDKDPEIERVWSDVLERAADRLYGEFVFCGYGESTYRLETMLELCRRLKHRYPRSGRRLNTIGLGSVICGRDIAPELAEGLTHVRVSLNTADPGQWSRLHRPKPAVRDRGFEGVVDFVRSCVLSDLPTTLTAVRLPGVDLPAVRRLAASLGASFLARPLLSAREAIE